METTLGSVQFLSITFQLLFLTTFIQMIIYHAISKKLNMHSNTTMTTSATMGFSSLLMGLLTVHAHHAETIECILFPGLQIDTSNAPMLAYLLASCLLTEASILNHFIAGFVGFVIGVGGLDWLSGYWLNCIFLYCIGGILISIKTTTKYGDFMNFIVCEKEKWPPWKQSNATDVEVENSVIDDSYFVMKLVLERIRVAQEVIREEENDSDSENENGSNGNRSSDLDDLEGGDLEEGKKNVERETKQFVARKWSEELQKKETKLDSFPEFDHFDSDSDEDGEENRLLGSNP